MALISVPKEHAPGITKEIIKHIEYDTGVKISDEGDKISITHSDLSVIDSVINDSLNLDSLDYDYSK